MNRQKKEFDAVKMMREIRNHLAKKYDQEPEERLKKLRAIREKYGIKEPSQTI